MGLVIYEDRTFENFYPLVYLRPVFELRCGMGTLGAKIERAASTRAAGYFVRGWLAASYAERAAAPVNSLASLGKGQALAVNGRLLAIGLDLPLKGPDEAGYAGDVLVYVRADASKFAGADAADFSSAVEKAAAGLPRKELKATVLSYFWQLIHNNAAALKADFAAAGRSGVEGVLAEGSYIWGPANQVYIARTAEVQPCVVLDTKNGPVYIDEEAIINPHTRIEGPAYIGPKTMIVGGKIREGTSIGEICRVGGEVEESIIHGCSNKYHDGFLGHAYVCEWVNLGAITTNSDLKNDYTTVKVLLGGKQVDTADTKVGSFIGDHTKTSINTMFNTGTVVGVMSNVVGTGFLSPKYVPSFVTFMGGRFYKQALSSACATARTAMGRRKRVMTAADEALFKYVRDLTREDTVSWVNRSRKGPLTE